MPYTNNEKRTHLETCGLIEPLCLSGPEQMALDVMLLDKSIKARSLSPLLRFYTWKGSWLSIGKNQSKIPYRWLKLIEKGKVQIVRRPTGGSAVLHSGGLTYSFIWPSAPRQRRAAYAKASEWLIKGAKRMC